ncbi:MAG: hypothetical protein SGARI_002446, partial [Bacillariaceae sp.]
GEEEPEESEDEKDEDRKPAAKKTIKRARSTSRSTKRRPTTLGQEEESDEEQDVPPAQSSQGSKNEDEPPAAESGSSTSSNTFPVGTIVTVERRTWAGINKPGGVGRITKVNEDGTFNVAYVLGGKEANVDETFITKEDEIEEAEKETAPVAARRRRRPADELPPELLQQLAEQGFDTGGFATGIAAARPGKKRKGSGRNKALTDSTNAGKKNSGSKKNASKPRGRKRKETPTSVVDGAESEEPTSEKKKTSQKKESTSKKARSEEPSDAASSASSSHHDFSDEDAAKIADGLYQKRFQAALDAKVVAVAASGLDEDDLAALKSLCSASKGENIKLKMTESITKKTTLAVVSADGVGDNITATLRTSKVLKCSVEGIPMITPEWISNCEKAGKIVPPSQFIRTLPTKVAEIEESGDAAYGVARMAALMQDRKNKKALPFHNHFAFVAGKFPGDMKSVVLQVFKEGGGKVLTTPLDVSSKLDAITKPNSAFAKVIVLCGDSGVSIPKSLEQELIVFLESSPSPKIAAVVDFKWVMDSITCAKAMPAKYFEPAAKKHLWLLSKE